MAADRARDFVARFLSDFSDFRTDPGERQLQDLGETASDTSRELADLGDDANTAARDVLDLGDDAGRAARDVLDLGDDATRAGSEVRELGADAETTARDVDDALERIAASSRANLRNKLGDDAEAGADKLREAGDEGIDTAREMGASFSGSADDVADAFQEVAANALQAFGVVGTAAGVVAAIGIGALRAQQERLRESTQELTADLIEGGGRIERDSVLSRLQEFAEDGSIRDLADQAEGAGIPVQDFLLAMAGDPAAIQRTTRAVQERKRATTEALQASAGLTSGTGAETQAYTNLERALGTTAQAYGLAQEAASTYLGVAEGVDDATALSTDTLDDYRQALTGFVDPLGSYTSLLAEKQEADRAAAQATADATESASDSWEDHASAVSVSVGELLTTLRDQVAAQEGWAANMEQLAGQVSESTLAELARMGPEGAPLVAELVDASAQELAELDSLFQRRAAAATERFTGELDAASGPARASGRAAGAAFAGGVREREGAAADAAGALVGAMQTRIDRQGALVIRTRIDPSGATSGLQTLVRDVRVRV